MRINFLIFVISIQRLDALLIDRSIMRKHSIENKINEMKSKHMYI
ncbi:hypothetical protein [Halobacillus litoralis]|nr:hypothetical protein [Halobacillus litoralis]